MGPYVARPSRTGMPFVSCTGNWVNKVVNDMVARKEEHHSDMRLYLYSAVRNYISYFTEITYATFSQHDTTVAAMTSGLGVYNDIIPPYAAAFIIELYSDSSRCIMDYFVDSFTSVFPYNNNSGYWVSLYYRNETNGTDLVPLRVDSCDNSTLCTLEEFIK